MQQLPIAHLLAKAKCLTPSIRRPQWQQLLSVQDRLPRLPSFPLKSHLVRSSSSRIHRRSMLRKLRLVWTPKWAPLLSNRIRRHLRRILAKILVPKRTLRYPARSTQQIHWLTLLQLGQRNNQRKSELLPKWTRASQLTFLRQSLTARYLKT